MISGNTTYHSYDNITVLPTSTPNEEMFMLHILLKIISMVIQSNIKIIQIKQKK